MSYHDAALYLATKRHTGGAGRLIPSLIGFAGSSSGAILSVAAAVAGTDMLILFDSNGGATTIPSLISGMTSFGSGISSNESTDSGVRVSGRIASSNGQSIDPTGSNRAMLLCFRYVDPLVLTTPIYAYNVTSGATMTHPALTLTEPADILCMGRIGATDAIDLPAQSGGLLNFIHHVSATNTELEAAWTGGVGSSLPATGAPVASWAGFTDPITSNAARTAFALALLGAPTP